MSTAYRYGHMATVRKLDPFWIYWIYTPGVWGSDAGVAGNLFGNKSVVGKIERITPYTGWYSSVMSVA